MFPEANEKVLTYSFTGVNKGGSYKLRLFRFKGVQELTIHLPEKDIVLLDGPSGIGKTTLLEAISFVLYDGAKNTCYPRADRNTRKKHEPTWVELTFPNGLVIYRQRRPNLFWIQGNGISLVDDAAQGYINDSFGPPSNWLAGGYLRQGDFCAFLSMSASDKLNLLQELTLPTHFETFLDRVSQKITEASREYHENVTQVQVYRDTYMSMYNTCPEDVRNQHLWNDSILNAKFEKLALPVPQGTLQEKLTLLYNSLDSELVNRKVQSLQNEIRQTQIKLVQMEQAQIQKAQLEQQLKEIEEKMGHDLSSEIAQLTTEVQDLQNRLLLAQKTERRSQLLAAMSEMQRRLDLIPDETSKYTPQQLDKFERIQKGPSLEQIDKTLEQIELARSYQSLLSEYQKRESVKSQLKIAKEQLEKYPKESVSDRIDILTRQIYLSELRKNKLVCPKCSSELYLNNGRLTELPESSDVSDLQKLLAEKRRLQEVERLYQQRGQIENTVISLQKTLDSF